MKRILSLVGVVLVVGSFYWFRGPPSDGPYEIYHDNGQLWERGPTRTTRSVVSGSKRVRRSPTTPVEKNQ